MYLPNITIQIKLDCQTSSCQIFFCYLPMLYSNFYIYVRERLPNINKRIILTWLIFLNFQYPLLTLIVYNYTVEKIIMTRHIF